MEFGASCSCLSDSRVEEKVVHTSTSINLGCSIYDNCKDCECHCFV